VTSNQPFLTGFPTQICGRLRRSLQDAIAAKRKQLAESSIATYALQFSHILPAEFMAGNSLSRRVRHYCNVVVFWAWLAQILEANASLSKTVSLIQSWCDEAGLPRPSEDTGGYSKGRGRLKIEFLHTVQARISGHLNARIRPEDTYLGHVIKSIDGSTLELDDTEANQLEYPQPSTQKPGCGFPIMGIMGVLNHSHGGWEGFVQGAYTAHDATVSHQLLHCLNPGDILCGDRAFCTYPLISCLLEKGVFSLMRLHQSRHRALDWRQGKKLDKNQRLVTWRKPAQQPSSSPLGAAEWEALPKTLEVRLIRFYYEDRDGKKRRMVLATTLTDPEKYDWQELAAIYAGRWDIELRLRDVKTTLQMERLRVKTPETARKTLAMSQIAYNLIKATCQQAGHESGADHRQISFKGALDTIVANTARYLRRQKHTHIVKQIWENILEMIAGKTIDIRPHRHEPRAIKKRPKNFSYLTAARSIFKEIPHRGKLRNFA
jgi:hypothetical protein